MRGAPSALVLLAATATTRAGAQSATQLPEGTSPPATLPSAPPPEEVVIHGAHPARNVTDVSVSAREARETAGTQGDPSKIVEDLPGVARPAFGSGGLIVWGASPRDTRVYVDGVEIPALFHGAALRSTVNGDLVRDVTLTPGAYGADYGRSLGGVLRIETRDLPATGVHGYAGADTLDGSGMVTAAASDRFRIAAAGRYGWIDGVLDAVHAPNVDPFFAVPRYSDYQAKAQLALRDGESLDGVFLGSRDDLTETIPDPDPSRVRRETTTSAYQRFYLRYRRAMEDGSSIDAVAWAGRDTSDLDAAFGGAPAALDQAAWRGGLRASHRSRPLAGVSMILGIDADGASTDAYRTGSLEVPPREGDLTVFGQPPGPGASNDSWNAGSIDVAPYAIVNLDLGPLAITPGLRADAFLLTTSRQTPRIGETPAVGLSRLDGVLEPRLAMSLRVTSRFTLLGAAGLYAQPPDPSDLSAVFGNPTLGPESADHVTLGEALRLTSSLSAEALGFYEGMNHLAVRNPSPTPQLAQALLEDGVGRSYGLEFLVRQQPWRGFSGWIAYTLSRSERRDVPGAAWRLFDYDQPHVLTIVGRKELGPWSLGARFRFAVGLPRTPVVGAFYDAKDDLYDPVFGPQNSSRLPDFWQLDLRVARRFRLGDGASLLVYVEALNVTNHTNGEETVYNANYTGHATVTGLPIVPVLGARMDL